MRRILGTERDLSEFERHAGAIPWLAPLARRMRGLKPPRYPALFEACANAIVFQQLSLYSASAIMRRLIPREELPADRSSWRTWPQRKLRRKVPKVEAALTRKPSTRSVPPARSAPASSMQSPPAIAEARLDEGQELVARALLLCRA